MKRLPILCLTVLLALATISAKTQVTFRNLLQAYTPQLAHVLIPRDRWKPFPRTPGEWRQFLPDSVLKRLVTRGEKALPFRFNGIPATVTLDFVRDGNRTRYEKLSFDKRNALWDLVLAEAIEGKGRFTDQILNGVWSICEESYWGISAHLGLQKAGKGLPDIEDPTVDLFTAETASVLAWTDYFVGDELEKISPLIRPRIYEETTRRVFDPLRTAKYRYIGGGRDDVKVNNWDPWIMSNFITADLLLEKDAQKREQALAMAMKYVDLYVNGLGDDGGCEEGPGYWSGAAACVFDALTLLHDATGGAVDIFEKPIIKNMAAYIYKTHIAGEYFVNVGDAHPQEMPDGIMLYRFGKAIGDTTLMAFGSWEVQTYEAGDISFSRFFRSRNLYDLAAFRACRRYPPEEPKEPDTWLPDVQLMASRTAGGLFLASHGGNNGESHNHNDIGDFIVYAAGQPVIIDVGSGRYTARTFSDHRYDLWFNTSAYHNLPGINGYQQGAGAQFAATGTRYDRNTEQARLTMNLATAYPAAAGIQSWQRTVLLDKKKDEVLVTDVYRAAGALKSLTQSFMTVCETDLTHPGLIVFKTLAGRPVQLTYDARMWTATREKIVRDEPEDELFRETWNGRPIYRILLTAKKLKAKGRIEYRITN